MTHRGDMSKEGVQFLISVENAILGEIVSRLDRAYALAPCLLVDRLSTAARGQRPVVSPVRRHRHLQS